MRGEREHVNKIQHISLCPLDFPDKFFFKKQGQIALSCVLYTSIHAWDVNAWSPGEFWKSLSRGGAFTSDSADCVLVSLLSSTVMPFLSYIAIRFGQADDKEDR